MTGIPLPPHILVKKGGNANKPVESSEDVNKPGGYVWHGPGNVKGKVDELKQDNSRYANDSKPTYNKPHLNEDSFDISCGGNGRNYYNDNEPSYKRLHLADDSFNRPSIDYHNKAYYNNSEPTYERHHDEVDHIKHSARDDGVYVNDNKPKYESRPHHEDSYFSKPSDGYKSTNYEETSSKSRPLLHVNDEGMHFDNQMTRPDEMDEESRSIMRRPEKSLLEFQSPSLLPDEVPLSSDDGQQKQEQILEFLRKFQRPVSTREIVKSCAGQYKDQLLPLIYELCDRGLVKRATGRVQAWRINNNALQGASSRADNPNPFHRMSNRIDGPLPSFDDLSKSKNDNSFDLSSQTSSGPPLPPHMLTKNKVTPYSYETSRQSSDSTQRPSQDSRYASSGNENVSNSRPKVLDSDFSSVDDSWGYVDNTGSSDKSCAASNSPLQPPWLKNVSGSKRPLPTHNNIEYSGSYGSQGSSSRSLPLPPHNRNALPPSDVKPMSLRKNESFKPKASPQRPPSVSKPSGPPPPPHLLLGQRKSEREVPKSNNNIQEPHEHKDVARPSLLQPHYLGGNADTHKEENHNEADTFATPRGQYLPPNQHGISVSAGGSPVPARPNSFTSRRPPQPPHLINSEKSKGPPPPPPHKMTLQRNKSSDLEKGCTNDAVKSSLLRPAYLAETRGSCEDGSVNSDSDSHMPSPRRVPSRSLSTSNGPPPPPHLLNASRLKGPPPPPHLLKGQRSKQNNELSTFESARILGTSDDAKSVRSQVAPHKQSSSMSKGLPPPPLLNMSMSKGPPPPPHLMEALRNKPCDQENTIDVSCESVHSVAQPRLLSSSMSKGPPPPPHLLNTSMSKGPPPPPHLMEGLRNKPCDQEISSNNDTIDVPCESVYSVAQPRLQSSSMYKGLPPPPHLLNTSISTGPPPPPHLVEARRNKLCDEETSSNSDTIDVPCENVLFVANAANNEFPDDMHEPSENKGEGKTEETFASQKIEDAGVSTTQADTKQEPVKACVEEG